MQGGWQHRHGLSRPRLLTRHVTSGSGTLFYREQQLARESVEKEQVPHLRALNHGRNLDTIPTERKEKWWRGQVIVPKVVMHHLIVPDDLSRSASQRYQRVGVAVVARSPTAIVVGAEAAGRDENQVVLFVCGERGPGVTCSRQ